MLNLSCNINFNFHVKHIFHLFFRFMINFKLFFFCTCADGLLIALQKKKKKAIKYHHHRSSKYLKCHLYKVTFE